MMRRDTGARRVLHVLAAFDPNEAQGSCVSTIAQRVPGEHALVCSSRSGDTDAFGAVFETAQDLWGFGWRDRSDIAAAVRSYRPDLVHFHGGPIGATTMSTGWTRGVPTVATIYGWPTVRRESWGRGVSAAHLRRTPVLAPRSFGNTLAAPMLVGAALRRSGVRVALTPDPAVAEALAHQAMPVGTFRGVTPPRPAVHLPTPDRSVSRRFVFAGRAELTRGPDLLAAAVEQLRSGGRDVTADFLFLGSRDAQTVAAATQVDGCTVSMGGADLDAEMRGALAVVLPFRFDETTLSPTMVATEAMACGVPVVGGDVRCLRAAVDHGRTGLLVRPNDVESLSAALGRLCDDAELARSLGAAARAEIQRRWRHSSIASVTDWAYAIASTQDGRRPPSPFAEPRPDMPHEEAS